jgi:hypothetical protein
MPRQYKLEGFAIVLFCASVAMVIAVGACFFKFCTFGFSWFPDKWASALWIAACINAHSIISRLARD